MSRPTATGEEIEAWANGELSGTDAERVLAAVLTDRRAAARLDDCLQLRAVGEQLRRERRRRRVTRTTVASLVSVAAVTVLYYGVHPHPDQPPQVVAATEATDPHLAQALDPHRHLEPRLSWKTFDRYREYDVVRTTGSPPHERLSHDLLGRLERHPDPRGLIDANVLLGNHSDARNALDVAPDTADIWSDRAALALVEGDPERALIASEHALAGTTDHAQARWNRALALAGLGLERSAAAEFAEIGRRGEPGWSAEAERRAIDLRGRRQRDDKRWEDARAAIAAMLAGGPPAPVIELVDSVPMLARDGFYEAVRAAASAERVMALQPLAERLDHRLAQVSGKPADQPAAQPAGNGVLTRYLARVATLPFARRTELANRYARLVRGELPGDERTMLVEKLRAGGRETADILLGAMPLVAAQQLAVADLPAYVRLAEATRDPWFAVLAKEQLAWAAIVRGDNAGADQELQVAAAQCVAPMTAMLPCYRIARLQTHVALVTRRAKAARDAWTNAWGIARDAGSDGLRADALRMAASLANLRDDTAGGWLGLASAYVEEYTRTGPRCKELMAVREEIAQALINQSRLVEAAALLEPSPACTPPFTARRAFLLGQTLHDPWQLVVLRSDIAALRAAPTTTAADRALLEHVDGRALLTMAPVMGRTALRRTIKATDGYRDDPQQIMVRDVSYAVLIQDAARRTAWGEVLTLLAEQDGVPPPARCALGASVEEGVVFAALSREGRGTGAYLSLAAGQQPTTAVPRELVAALEGCPLVDLHARYPYYGRPGLLPPQIASRFRSHATASAPDPGPVLVIGNITPPPDLHLAPLQPILATPGTTLLDGAGATPARALIAMRTASFVEIHSHGLAGSSADDTAKLVLSPEPGGRYALSAAEVAQNKLARHPIVVLAACDAGGAAPSFQAASGLADAFLDAGASAVIASPSAIGDAAAPRFFAGVRTRIQAGSGPTEALRDEREAWSDPAQRRWIDQLVVFQ
jgi:cellulose synthase operon protein C